MKYLFTTLAIGQSYLTNAIQLFEDLNGKTQNCEFSITTDILFTHSFIHCNLYNGEYFSGPYKVDFFYNLKCLALKTGLNYSYDFIIYLDSDFRIGDQFDEKKFMDLFQHMIANEIDFEFERKWKIGMCKQDVNSFCKDKISDFGLMLHGRYDEAYVPNEQVLIYRNGPKFFHYIQSYERWFWYCVHNKIRHYAEGVEMGISALEAGMKCEVDIGFTTFLSRCFTFDDGRGNTYHKF